MHGREVGEFWQPTSSPKASGAEVMLKGSGSQHTVQWQQSWVMVPCPEEVRRQEENQS